MEEQTNSFDHWCEVCGTTEVLTSEEAFNAGWDYPPHIGEWGVLSQRTCPQCPMTSTIWWAVVIDGYDMKQLSVEQRRTVVRIISERPDGPS